VKIERTVGFVRDNFWAGLPISSLNSLTALNQQGWAWIEEVNHRMHSPTREVPYERFAREKLRGIADQPDYDTSYVSYREVAKDCLISYRGNRYSAPQSLCGQARGGERTGGRRPHRDLSPTGTDRGTSFSCR